MLKAIKKHYPHLEKKYKGYFKNTSQMPRFYRDAFYKEMKKLGKKFGLRSRILSED